MAANISKKETRSKLRDSILKVTEEISVSPASKRVRKVVKSASRKISKELTKDIRKLSKKAEKLVKKARKAKNKPVSEPAAAGS